MIENSVLINKWRHLFNGFELSDKYLLMNDQNTGNYLHELYDDVNKRFCRVADNQFRKDILHQVGKAKTERLRKRIDTKSTSKSEFSMKSVNEDKSDEKYSTHLKLKSKIFDDSKSSFNGFLKTDLAIVCKAYEIQFTAKDSINNLKEIVFCHSNTRQNLTSCVFGKRL